MALETGERWQCTDKRHLPTEEQVKAVWERDGLLGALRTIITAAAGRHQVICKACLPRTLLDHARRGELCDGCVVPPALPPGTVVGIRSVKPPRPACNVKSAVDMLHFSASADESVGKLLLGHVVSTPVSSSSSSSSASINSIIGPPLQTLAIQSSGQYLVDVNKAMISVCVSPHNRSLMHLHVQCSVKSCD